MTGDQRFPREPPSSSEGASAVESYALDSAWESDSPEDTKSWLDASAAAIIPGRVTSGKKTPARISDITLASARKGA